MEDKDLTAKILDIIENNIKTSSTGRTSVPNFTLKKIAIMLGGDYNSLSKIQKDIFRSDICMKRFNSFEYYKTL